MKMKKLVLYIGLFLATFSYAQEAKGTYGTFLLKGGTVHTVTNGVITADVLISEGMIESIDAGIVAPDGATVIDCSGLHLYPGMIDGGTSIGLSEIGSVPETQDNVELGDIKPHVKALTAVNPNSVLFPVNRATGVTAAITKPSGGLFPGTAALIHFHGYTPEQMHTGYSAVVMNFPSFARRGRRDRRSEDEIKKDAKERLETVNKAFEKARLYHQIDSAHKANPANQAPEYYPEMEQLSKVITGELDLMIEVNGANDILGAIDWVEKMGMDNVIFSGVLEGWRVADSIAEAGIPVITGPVLSTPTRSYDKYDRPYANAGIMAKAGVKVAIRSNENENVRNLPFNAGFAATYGMGKEEALRAVTITPAEIFGMDDKMGSIEEGKWADIIVSTGDPFETRSQVRELFIAGWRMPLENRHSRLYEEFLDRDPGITKE